MVLEREDIETPTDVRAAVLDRDGHSCRFCGGYVEHPALHHVVYRSEGGLDVVENLVTLHWFYDPRCHETVHGTKWLWQPLLQQVIDLPAVSALQLRRWLQ